MKGVISGERTIRLDKGVPTNRQKGSGIKMTETEKVLIEDWHRKGRQSQKINYTMGNIYLRYHYVIGIMSIIFSTIVSSAFFDQINQGASTTTNMKYVMAVLSILVAILAALQTFFRFAEKSEKYKLISAKYGAVVRQLEYLMSQEEITKDEFKRQITEVRKSMDELTESSLNIPEGVKKKVSKKLNSEPRKNKLFADYDIK